MSDNSEKAELLSAGLSLIIWRGGEALCQGKSKRSAIGSTRKGSPPGRFSLLLDGRDARHYGSEGQQKELFLPYVLQNLFICKSIFLLFPFFLRMMFWESWIPPAEKISQTFAPTAQTFATGTSYPSIEDEVWETFGVKAGLFQS